MAPNDNIDRLKSEGILSPYAELTPEDQASLERLTHRETDAITSIRSKLGSGGSRRQLGRREGEAGGHHGRPREDLGMRGGPGGGVGRRPPADSTARAVGAQYYWIRHHHPVALLGYVAVLEGRPPSVEFLD